MKVRIKATGEVFNVQDYARVPVENYDSMGEVLDYRFDEVELLPDEPHEQKSEIDWEQRRYEIARECLAGLASSNADRPFEKEADWAITYADELIKRLKGE